MREHAPDGRLRLPTAYVFGNECGKRCVWAVSGLGAGAHGVR